MANGSGPNREWTELDEFYHQKVISSDQLEREKIVAEPNCPEWLLEGTLRQDTYEEVLLAAAKNTNAKSEWIKLATDRFPHLAQFIKLHDQEEKLKIQMAGDRDQFIRKHILGLENNKNNKSKKITNTKNPKKEWTISDKPRIAMIMAPSWGKFFPPYGTAKLTALLRQFDYPVKVYDLNVESSYVLKQKTGINYWETNRYFMWEGLDTFNDVLLPHLREIFDEAIADILASEVKVVGFSMYNTNQHAVLYIAKKLRLLDPSLVLLVGGPGATMTGEWWFGNTGEIFNYIFKGEAEEQLMYLLENMPAKHPYNKILGSVDSRLTLEDYPFPDYTDYNLDLYEIKGVSLETSRGCTAKCSFCAETHFWKYRNKQAERIVDELSHQVKKYGTDRFWFVDSLINGTLKNFEAWMDLVIERKIKLRWNCYSRCDGRMTADFFKKIKQSGCTMLSFGIESGSQKVLDDMHKKVKVWEILQNMQDCHAAGVFIHSSWLQAFPTETPLDHLHSRQLIFSCRKWIGGASLGMGAGITPNSDMDTNWQAYDIQWKHTHADGTIWKGHSEDKFLGDWYTADYKNTVIQRLLRVKLMNVWCHSMKTHWKDTITDFGLFYPDMNKFYSLTFKQLRPVDILEQNLYIDTSQGVTDDFAGWICQDYLSFIYSLFEVYGELTWTFHCDPQLDKKNFGDFLARLYWCDVSAIIDQFGNYELTIYHKLDHSDALGEDYDRSMSMSGEVDYAAERIRKDMSFEQQTTLRGNFNNWVSDAKQVNESVHLQYRKLSWIMKTAKETLDEN